MESTEVEVDTLHSVAMIHAGLQTHFHYRILFRNSVMMMDLTECKQLLQCCLTYKEIKKITPWQQNSNLQHHHCAESLTNLFLYTGQNPEPIQSSALMYNLYQ
jgi:hypothetical protein